MGRLTIRQSKHPHRRFCGPTGNKVLEKNNFVSLKCHEITMKRKLDQDNVPSPVDVEAPQETKQTFQALGLDSRLLTAISTENFASPTLVQEKAIPLALEGKDLLGNDSGPTLSMVSH